MTNLIEEVAKAVAEYQGPLVGTPEHLADAVWVARRERIRKLGNEGIVKAAARVILEAEPGDEEMEAAVVAMFLAQGVAQTEDEARAMRKHTPGPWEVHSGYLIRACSGDICVPIAELRPPYRKQVGLVRGYSEECANATLIASAPDLLAERDRLREVNAALLAALELAESHIDTVCGETSEADLPDWFSNRERIRAAITKAKGGAQ